jgi:hypothetical protein
MYEERRRQNEVSRAFYVGMRPSYSFLAQTLPNPISYTASSPSPNHKSATRRRPSIPMPTRSNSSLLPWHIILSTLPPVHIAFFTCLDKQLEKIDGFYSEREKEAQIRSKALELQLRELKDHRKIFYVSILRYVRGLGTKSDYLYQI